MDTNLSSLLMDVLLRGRWRALSMADQQISEFIRELAVRGYEISKIQIPR